jgi:hypothetical protein
MVVNLVAVVIALLLGALAGGVIVGVGSRGRRRDDDATIAQALADLVELAVGSAYPDRRENVQRRANMIADRWQPDGHHIIAEPAPVLENTPDYVHRLLDAMATGARLDLAGCWVPGDVTGRLRAMLAGEAPSPIAAAGHDPTAVNAELLDRLKARFLEQAAGPVTVLRDEDRWPR